MQVSNIQHYNYSVKKQPSFGLNARQYRKIVGLDYKLIRNSSLMHRNDLDWTKFALKIAEIFKHKNKVNVYSAACSDGSEAYTLAIALLEHLGAKNSKKFFPIIGSDIDKTILEAARSKLINLSKYEIGKTPNFERYFEKTTGKMRIKEDKLDGLTETYSVKQELSSLVKFEYMPIIERIQGLEDNADTVLMCRNVFPYFSGEREIKNVINAASQKLKPGSLLVIGDYDYSSNIRRYLSEHPFRKIEDYIYQR